MGFGFSLGWGSVWLRVLLCFQGSINPRAVLVATAVPSPVPPCPRLFRAFVLESGATALVCLELVRYSECGVFTRTFYTFTFHLHPLSGVCAAIPYHGDERLPRLQVQKELPPSQGVAACGSVRFGA